MKLEDLKAELANDLKLDVANLQTATHRVPILVGKWLNYRAQAKSMLAKAERDLNTVRRNQFLYYIGKHPEMVSDMLVEKSEIKIVLAGDPEVMKSELMMAHVKNVLAHIEDSIKAIRDLGFTVKNIIDLRKLEAGVV
ncbi:hypothetical protein VPHD479_0034 [Vibrio phage D479]